MMGGFAKIMRYKVKTFLSTQRDISQCKRDMLSTVEFLNNFCASKLNSLADITGNFNRL